MKSNIYSKYVCLYFQLHQPFRLSKYNYFDINSRKDYFGKYKHTNKYFISKVANKSYYPATRLLLKLLKNNPEFKVAFSFSGVFLEQLETYEPELLQLFQKIVNTKNVEILGETYYHSLAHLYSLEEFLEQVNMHRKIIWRLFRRKTKTFRNTELIYNDKLARHIKNLGFENIITEGWDKYLYNSSPNYLYSAKNIEINDEELLILNQYRFSKNISNSINLLLKNYKLSDDIAFRFSDTNWNEYPLTVEKYTNWLANAEGKLINIFMDYETIGEHQWEESGIFDFLSKLPKSLLKNNIGFINPKEICKKLKVQNEISIPKYISWADSERDLSAWIGNKMQKQAIKSVYKLQKTIYKIKNKLSVGEYRDTINIWRRLQISDHFYYMSTKYWQDGDIHKYFSPYESPYDAYINYMNILSDFQKKLNKLLL
jgi:alpha-amylase